MKSKIKKDGQKMLRYFESQKKIEASEF